MTRDPSDTRPEAPSGFDPDAAVEAREIGVRGAPYGTVADPAAFAYGEPKGPKPPHFTAPGTPADPAATDRTAPERDDDGFVGGLSTPETYRTTGDETPAEVRRDLPTFRREEEDGDAGRSER